jgi:uncharacterized protein (TIGR02996 family)
MAKNPPKQTLHPELLALLHAAKAHAEDDAPRLVLADWLEEHGDEADVARAQLVRLQCRQAHLEFTDRLHQEIEQQVNDLARRYGKTWLGPLASFVQDHVLPVRGLFCLFFRARRFLDPQVCDLAASTAWGWVEGVSLHRARGVAMSRLASAAQLQSLGKLDLSSNALGPRRLAVLLTSRHLRNLTALRLTGNLLGDEGLTALAGTPLPNLRHLALGSNQLTAAAMQALADTPTWPRLRELELGWNPLGRDGAQALAAGRLGQLRVLSLRCAGLADGGTEALAASSSLTGLTTLDLAHNQIGDEGAAALAASPILAPVRTLHLSSNGSTDAGATALAASPHVQQLTSLDLGDNRITDRGARALADSPYLTSLTSLNLSAARMSAASVRALLESPSLPSLRELCWDFHWLGEAAHAELRRRFEGRVRLEDSIPF